MYIVFIYDKEEIYECESDNDLNGIEHVFIDREEYKIESRKPVFSYKDNYLRILVSKTGRKL